MGSKERTEDQIFAERAEGRRELGQRLANLMSPMGLEDGYDWDIADGVALARTSIVVLRSTELVNCELLVGLARCLRELSWDLFVAEDSPGHGTPRPIAMVYRWGAGPVQATAPEQATIDEANAVLRSEGLACGYEDN